MGERGTVLATWAVFKNCAMVKFFSLIVGGLLLGQTVAAQTDSTIFETPNPYAACEMEAKRVSLSLGNLNIQQRDSIAALLVTWEHQCGTGETSARLDLLLAISEKSLSNKAIELYYEQYLPKFYDRRNFAQYNDATEYYEKHKGYWEFIPLNGRFDRWTAATAKALLDSQAEGSDARLLCLLFSGAYSEFSRQRSSYAYRGSHSSRIFKEKYGLIYGWEVETTVLFGSWLPQGRMGEMYHPSPQVAFQVSLPIAGQTRGQFGFGFTLLQQKQAVRLLAIDTIVDAKTRVGFQFGGGVSQRFQCTEKWKLDLSGDLAYNYIVTNQKRSATDPEYGETAYGIGALDLGLSVGIERQLSARRSLGLSFGLHHVPYGFDRKLMTPLGNTYAVAGLKMRFW